MTMEQIFEEIKQDHGEAVFCNGELLLNLFADYSKGKIKPQQNQLDIFLKCDGNTCILNLRNATRLKQQTEYSHLIQKIVNEYGMQKEYAEAVCKAFWKVVYDTPVPVNDWSAPPQPETGIPVPLPSAKGTSGFVPSHGKEELNPKGDLRDKVQPHSAKKTVKKNTSQYYRKSRNSKSPAEVWHNRILMIWTFFSFVPCFCMMGFYDAEPGMSFICAMFILLDLFATILKGEKIKVFIPILEAGVFLSGLPYVFSKISVPKDSVDYPVIIFIMIVITVWAVLTVLVHIFLANFEKVKAYIEGKEEDGEQTALPIMKLKARMRSHIGQRFGGMARFERIVFLIGLFGVSVLAVHILICAFKLLNGSLDSYIIDGPPIGFVFISFLVLLSAVIHMWIAGWDSPGILTYIPRLISSIWFATFQLLFSFGSGLWAILASPNGGTVWSFIYHLGAIACAVFGIIWYIRRGSVLRNMNLEKNQKKNEKRREN